MNPVVAGFVDRIKDHAENRMVLGRMSDWLQKNTTLNGRPFSFKGHEFQIEIADCQHFDMCVIKPSQVGMSELTARIVLGFLASNTGAVAMYTMPTLHEAQRFVKGRFDPVIEGSKTLSNMMKSASDGSSFKQIGGSQLYSTGTWGKAVISIPCDMVVHDEVDFSNMETLKTAESRLSHSRFAFDPTTGRMLTLEALDKDDVNAIRGLRKSFSTPTLPEVGVSAAYEASDQRKRLCKCKACHGWFWPAFLDHVVVDGWDKPLDEMTHHDAKNLDSRGLLDTAKIVCPRCRNVIEKGNLMPQYRSWVAEKPSVVTKRGYWVSPFDLPSYHTPASLLHKLIGYGEETGHFRNFSLGLPYADSTNSVVDAVVRDCTVLTPVPPDQAAATGVSGCVAGLDVGKTSWFVVGKRVQGRLHVLWAEQVTLSKPGEAEGKNLEDRVVQLLKSYRVIAFVCDSLPYTDTILRLKHRYSATTPAEYSLKDKSLPMYVMKEDTGTVAMNRTKVIDYLVKRVNSGYFLFPDFGEMDTVRSHLQGMKRVDKPKETGEVVSEWVKTKPDHYFHAMNYMNVAADAIERSLEDGWLPAPSFKEATVGSRYVDPDQPKGYRPMEAA